jgi:hypothetical protein
MAALRDYLIVRGVDLFHVANLNNSEALNKLVLLLIARNCDRCDGLSVAVTVATHVCANSRSESKPPRARSVAGINRELRVEGTVYYRVFIKRRSNKQKSIETQVAYGAIRTEAVWAVEIGTKDQLGESDLDGAFSTTTHETPRRRTTSATA